MNDASRAAGANVVERGFTLVELLIVIVIMGVLAGIVVFAVGNLTSNARSTGCTSEVREIQTALETYKAQAGDYPASGAGYSAMDLLSGAASPPGTPEPQLQAAPQNYTIDDSGNITAIAGNPNNCT